MEEVRIIVNYKIGTKASFSKTISESDVYLFAGITGDLNPVHISKIEAKKTIFKERVAHGILVSGLISNVIGMQLPGPGTIYMEQHLKFLKPVIIGDTVTAVVTVTTILNVEKGILKLSTDVFNEENEQVITGEAIVKAQI